MGAMAMMGTVRMATATGYRKRWTVGLCTNTMASTTAKPLPSSEAADAPRPASGPRCGWIVGHSSISVQPITDGAGTR